MIEPNTSVEPIATTVKTIVVVEPDVDFDIDVVDDNAFFPIEQFYDD